MKRLLFLILLINFRQGIGQTYVLIPDVNFVSFLQAFIPTAMNGNSLNITHTLVTTTQVLNCNSANISDLSGIQYFTSLQDLTCSFNYLTTLPTLPNSLLNLYCNNNSITSLPTLPNSLQLLGCNINSLTNLPQLPNSLTTLNCSTNSITSLPSLPNSLQSLICYINPLSGIPILPNSLLLLECRYCSLTSLPALPNSITTLYCSYNSLNALPSLPNSLQTLNCDNNNIVCFPIFPNALITAFISINPFNCLPNYVLPAMNNYTTVPICAPGNTNGCTFVTGIKAIGMENYHANIFPNPTKGQLVIETSDTDDKSIQIFDLNGQHVFRQMISDNSNIDLSNLNEGVYNLTIKTVDKITNKKLVIVH